MKIRKKINEELISNIRTIELVKKDSIEKKENILDCNVNIDLLIQSAKEIVFICENMKSVNKLTDKFSIKGD
tara:strand:+ start:296 stop:511 length:216 start_codon:yes stop_codon:yes gene_type:complete